VDDDLEPGPGLNRLQATSDHKELYDILLDDFRAIPGISNTSQYDKYAIVNVSPSVVPNPYLPTFRIFSYNITGADGSRASNGGDDRPKGKKGTKRKHGHHRDGNRGDKESECRKAPYQDSWKCRLNQPWHSDPEAASRTNTLWSPLGYAQVRIMCVAGRDYFIFLPPVSPTSSRKGK